MRILILVISASVLQLLTSEAMAVNASPNAVDLQQPDGTKIQLKLRGNEYVHWYEDIDGYTVVERDDQTYVYAALGARSSLTVSDRVVGKDSPPEGMKKHLMPPRFRSQLRMRRLPARMSSAPQRTTQSGQVKNLVILMRFSDHVGRILPTPSDYDTIFNNVGGDPSLAPTGSVRDVYLENSYGKLELNSTIYAWVTLPRSEAYYANGDSGLTPRIAEAIRDALALADDLVDFDQFDQDNDDWVDAIAFVHSGYGAEAGGFDADGAHLRDRIWSHRWSIPTWTSDEGVRVSDYHINAGLWGLSGSDPVRIGLVCHETGHFFGLPDLYDTSDDGGEGIGSWGLMANSWGFDGTQLHPPHFCAWSKVFLGWNTPIEINSSGTYTVPQVETKQSDGSLPTIYKITSGFATGEYLLIENRQAVGYDSAIPSAGTGLAVWHIDDFKDGNSDPGFLGQVGWPQNNRHYQVSLLQADGQYDLERGNDRGDARDLYHKHGRDRVDGSSTPSTDRYQFGNVSPSGVSISDISASGSDMTFRLATGSSAAPGESGMGRSAVAIEESANDLFAAADSYSRKTSKGNEKEYVRLMEAALRMANPTEDLGRSILVNPSPQAASRTAIAVVKERAVKKGRLIENATWRKNQQRLWNEVLSVQPPGKRIFGGRRANKGEFPACVAIGSSTQFCCTGTLIGSNVVLTAGHCVDGGCASRVYLGLDSNLPDSAKIFNVKKAVLHPNYNAFTLENDIALLILEKEVPGVEPAPISSGDDVDDAFFVRLAGYGFTEFGDFGVQMTVDVATASNSCSDTTSQATFGCHADRELVAGGNGLDSCNGDSGGPAFLVKNGTMSLAGITSRAASNSLQSCGDGGIYVRADKYLTWIHDTASANGGRCSSAAPKSLSSGSPPKNAK